MSTPEVLLIATVIFAVLPAAVCNWTARALVVSWALSFVSFWAFGHTFSMTESIYIDMAVIAAIMCKESRTFGDLIVTGLFIPAWAAYFFADDPWWPVWWITMAQYFIVGGEALYLWFVRDVANSRTEYPDFSEFRAWAWGHG